MMPPPPPPSIGAGQDVKARPKPAMDKPAKRIKVRVECQRRFVPPSILQQAMLASLDQASPRPDCGTVIMSCCRM